MPQPDFVHALQPCTPLRVLIGCEFSGVVRAAFTAHGHDAVSCDLVPSQLPGPHLQEDVRDVLDQGWDLALFFPPCTHLAASGARWWKDKAQEQAEALMFVRTLLAAPIPRILLENPVGCISTRIRPPDQVIQPWMFGDEATKTTCLWLKRLPHLQPTTLAWPRPQRCWRMGQSRHRARERSRTYPGIAQAMATQYGGTHVNS